MARTSQSLAVAVVTEMDLKQAAQSKLAAAEEARAALSPHASPSAIAEADKDVARAQSTLEWLQSYAAGEDRR